MRTVQLAIQDALDAMPAAAGARRGKLDQILPQCTRFDGSADCPKYTLHWLRLILRLLTGYKITPYERRKAIKREDMLRQKQSLIENHEDAKKQSDVESEQDSTISEVVLQFNMESRYC